MSRSNNKRFHLDCDCGCGILEIERWYWGEKDEDNSLSLNYFIKADHIYGYRSLLKRIKFAWFFLIGKDYSVFDLCIRDDQIKDLKEFFESV
jgi:hypothetical protein